MTRQKYSAKEALNRILRILEGSPTPTDTPGAVTGELLSEDGALSDIAELLAGSLPSQNIVPVPAMTRYGHIFAHMATGTVVVSATDTFYAVSGGFHAGLLEKFTFANAMHLSPTLAGRYFITYSISVQSPSANQEIETALMINSIGQTGSSAHTEATGVNKPHVLAGNMITDLAAASIVGLAVANHTGANNLLVAHGNVSIFMIAPYGG
jgi:hypothetical protein